MGLLRSLKPDTPHKYFYKNKALEPFLVNFSVHEEEGRMLTEETNERFLMADGVSRVPVEEGNIHGVLFTPPGEGPFPAVLDLSTVRSEKRGCLLANKGFIVLTVPVVNGKLSDSKELLLDHTAEAVHFLNQLPKVGSKRVGIISRSKASEIALSLSAFVPGVEAVVWINGCSANAVCPLYYKKRQILPALIFDMKKGIPTESGALMVKNAIHDPLKEENRASLIPIEKANSRFLFVASEDDLSWDSKAYMEQMVERLKHHGKNNFETLSYPGAGHLLDAPYGPFCPSGVHPVMPKPALWGGEPRAHAAAEVHLWKKIQEFFKTHLSCDDVQNKPKL
ncbi:putative acyl-coenzyme A thioesterase 6 [Austrofundulus limnaeus]|uniref:Acyl-coenzyme A thioesterase 6 n=1 Tax=Austrofundulus limnaeus TaxID=52670 RepID=A0A2I4DBU4_AUSLI|nr:PREDICTED: putative acyl-coenzyme A thioesterase 6 [Austrofundulus limnaeus]